MELQVYQVDGSETGRTVALEAGVFGIEPNDHVLWLDVRRTQATRRQGTHKAKERGEIAGSTRKLYRQKGTGMARSGTIKSPLRRSGGRVFGPRPRNYGLKLTKKTRRLARRSALSYKAQGDAIRIIEATAFDEPSTRQLVDMIAALDLTGRKVLFLTAKAEEALYRSSRNVAKVHVQEARNASTEELLNAAVIVLEESALDVLSETLGGSESDSTSSVQPEAVVAEAPAEAPVAETTEAVEEVAAEVEAPAAEDAAAETEEVAAEPEAAADAEDDAVVEAVADAEDDAAVEAVADEAPVEEADDTEASAEDDDNKDKA